MIAPPASSDSWSRRQWSWLVGFVFAAQCLLVLLLSDRTSVSPRGIPETTRSRLALDASATLALNDPLMVGDPTLFALPNPHGFSGPAWLAVPSLDHRLTPWAEPPGWLSASTDQLGEGFLEFVATNSRPRVEWAEKPLPRLTDLAAGSELVSAPSAVRVEGDLQGRPLVRPLTVPEVPHEDVLRASVVQVLVGPDGAVFSAILVASSLLKTADERALELARTARFQPLKSGETQPSRSFMGGTLVFTWQTSIPTAPAAVP